MQLANKKKIRCELKENAPLINKDKVIMLYNTDFDGNVTFELAEILSKNGKYRLLNNGEIRQGLPFSGRNPDPNYSYEIVDYEYGERARTVHGIDYAQVDREDNVCFINMGIMYSDNVERVYPVRKLFYNINRNKVPLYYGNIIFGNNPEKRKEFRCFYYDNLGLFTKNKSSKEDWLKFQQDINAIYKRNLHIGKNCLPQDEKIVEVEVDNWKKDMQKMHEKMMKDFNIQTKVGQSEESLFP